jgi:hypothetical protein
MTKNIIIGALILATAACGKGENEHGLDWSGKPLDVTLQSKVNNVAFSVKVPKGWKLDEEKDDPAAITKRWRPDMKDYFSEPSVAIAYAAIPATDLEGYVKDAMLDDKDVVAKKEATADGFLLVTHTKNKGIVRVSVLKKKGEHHVECRVSQARTGGVPSPDKTMAWMESLCTSLALE